MEVMENFVRRHKGTNQRARMFLQNKRIIRYLLHNIHLFLQEYHIFVENALTKKTIYVLSFHREKFFLI